MLECNWLHIDAHILCGRVDGRSCRVRWPQLYICSCFPLFCHLDCFVVALSKWENIYRCVRQRGVTWLVLLRPDESAQESLTLCAPHNFFSTVRFNLIDTRRVWRIQSSDCIPAMALRQFLNSLLHQDCAWSPFAFGLNYNFAYPLKLGYFWCSRSVSQHVLNIENESGICIYIELSQSNP